MISNLIHLWGYGLPQICGLVSREFICGFVYQNEDCGTPSVVKCECGNSNYLLKRIRRKYRSNSKATTTSSINFELKISFWLCTHMLTHICTHVGALYLQNLLNWQPSFRSSYFLLLMIMPQRPVSASYVYYLLLIWLYHANILYLVYNLVFGSFKFRLSEGVTLLLLQQPIWLISLLTW